MKLMIISDIHGIKTNLDLIKKKYNELNCDKLICLGDIYYNYNGRFMVDYDPDYVRDFLKSFGNNLVCIRGNCDVNVKEEPFPIIDGYSLIESNGLDIYLTHGHIHNKYNWPYKNTILVSGHTHIAEITSIENNLYVNPGSISLPLSRDLPSYCVFSDGHFTIYDVTNKVLYFK